MRKDWLVISVLFVLGMLLAWACSDGGETEPRAMSAPAMLPESGQ
jgi:hypothetical protein